MAKAKQIEGLDCGADASAGVRLVLLTRFGEAQEFREAALNWGDTEGVHDMRVASRRLRSALKDFLPHVRRRGRFDEAREGLKRLARALGEVRDQDVAIGELEKLRQDAPPEALAGLEQIMAERVGRRAEARERLERSLTEKALGGLREEFEGALEDATRQKRRRKKGREGEGDGGDGGHESGRSKSFRELGRAVILHAWEELEGLSRSLYRPLKPRRLHKMRIAAKRLRYALELFAPCYGGATKAFAEEVAELQGALGELHDCDEWVAWCGAWLGEEDNGPGASRGGGAEGEARSRRRGAGVWLLGHFAEERARHYRRALTLWHSWEQGDFEARLTACLDADYGRVPS